MIPQGYKHHNPYECCICGIVFKLKMCEKTGNSICDFCSNPISLEKQIKNYIDNDNISFYIDNLYPQLSNHQMKNVLEILREFQINAVPGDKKMYGTTTWNMVKHYVYLDSNNKWYLFFAVNCNNQFVPDSNYEKITHICEINEDWFNEMYRQAI